MNFYKHHIGDYAQATAHLSFVEDAAYSRLLRKYYAEESPLPVDLKAVQRLVGARSKEEREAVELVLGEFFELQPDGWHNKRADVELGKANAQAEANRKVAADREQRRREREERERLANEQSTNRSGQQHDSLNDSSNDSLPSREPSQTPDSRHQTPDTRKKEKGESTSDSAGRSRRSAPPQPDGVSPQVWADWQALRKAKKAPVTETVLEAAKTEAGKAGMSLEAFLRVWCARGSQGLQADWLKPTEKTGRVLDLHEAGAR